LSKSIPCFSNFLHQLPTAPIKWNPTFEGFGFLWESMVPPKVLLEQDSDEEMAHRFGNDDDLQLIIDEELEPAELGQNNQPPPKPTKWTPRRWCTIPVGGWRCPRVSCLNGIPHFTIRHKQNCQCTDFPPSLIGQCILCTSGNETPPLQGDLITRATPPCHSLQ
jgi:hypothetical protein